MEAGSGFVPRQNTTSGSISANMRRQISLFRQPSISEGLARTGSIYSLTLEEFEKALAPDAGKSFGSLNLDELLKSVCFAAEEGALTAGGKDGNTEQAAQNLLPAQGALGSRQLSFMPGTLGSKTVEEVWREINRNTTGKSGGPQEQPAKQNTFGDMTLEDFLDKAGVSREFLLPPAPAGNGVAPPPPTWPKNKPADANGQADPATLPAPPPPSAASSGPPPASASSPAAAAGPQQFPAAGAFQRKDIGGRQGPSGFTGFVPTAVPGMPPAGVAFPVPRLPHAAVPRPPVPTAGPPGPPPPTGPGFIVPAALPADNRAGDSWTQYQRGLYAIHVPTPVVGTVKVPASKEKRPRASAAAATATAATASAATSSPPRGGAGSPRGGSEHDDGSSDDSDQGGGKRGKSVAGAGGSAEEDGSKKVERRQRRMIKNRESAARSRARKQAYTQELEQEVSALKEENRKLKKQRVLADGEEAVKELPAPKLRRTRSI